MSFLKDESMNFWLYTQFLRWFQHHHYSCRFMKEENKKKLIVTLNQKEKIFVLESESNRYQYETEIILFFHFLSTKRFSQRLFPNYFRCIIKPLYNQNYNLKEDYYCFLHLLYLKTKGQQGSCHERYDFYSGRKKRKVLKNSIGCFQRMVKQTYHELNLSYQTLFACWKYYFEEIFLIVD